MLLWGHGDAFELGITLMQKRRNICVGGHSLQMTTLYQADLLSRNHAICLPCIDMMG